MSKKKKKIKAVVIKDCLHCDCCIPIGEGDHWCDETDKIIIEDYIPNENYRCCVRSDNNVE